MKSTCVRVIHVKLHGLLFVVCLYTISRVLSADWSSLSAVQEDSSLLLAVSQPPLLTAND